MKFPPPPIDYDYAVDRITKFIRSYVGNVGAQGVVLGISGGLDSSVAAALAVKALGPEKVVGLIMPERGVTPPQDVEDAVTLSKMLGIKYIIVEINSVVESFKSFVGLLGGYDRLALGNLKARVRMILLYYYANRNGMLVCGTTDKSELLLGYYTKYGDGGADIEPIADLYKTQVRELARRLGLPQSIVSKPSSPALWHGQLAEEELGLSYDVIDNVLYHYVDLGFDPEDIARRLGLSLETVYRIVKRVHANEHKRAPPPVARVSKCSVHHDWRMPLLMGASGV